VPHFKAFFPWRSADGTSTNDDLDQSPIVQVVERAQHRVRGDDFEKRAAGDRQTESETPDVRNDNAFQ